VVGEADGRAKYRLAAEERGGADAERLAAVLAAERRREAGMRRAGAAVVRWSAADVLLPHRARELADHLRREVADASTRNAFTGRALCGPGRERAPPSSALRGPERGRELRGRGRERPGRERGEAST
jgi:hypothetical protein